ncbi:hypothetical protein EON83_29645 [bacterium]|nr:MAG: hypothetical protein EON83_29645 [bacterium]
MGMRLGFKVVMSNEFKHVIGGALVMGVLWAASGSAQASSCRWVGPENGAWNSALNWSTRVVPGVQDDVIIDANKVVAVPADVTVASLTVGANAEVKNGGKIKVTGVTNSLGLFTGAGTLDIPAGATAVYDVTAANLLAKLLRRSRPVVFAPINNKGTIITKVASGCKVEFAKFENAGKTQITSEGEVTFKEIKNSEELSISGTGSLTLGNVTNASGATLSIDATAPTGTSNPLRSLFGANGVRDSHVCGLFDDIDLSVIHLDVLNNMLGGTVILKGSKVGRYYEGKSIYNSGDLEINGAQTLLADTVVNAPAGTLTIESDAAIYASDGEAPTLNNAGKLIKPAGSDATLSVDWNNSGNVVVENGTLHVQMPFGEVCKQTAGTTTLEGGVISVEDASGQQLGGTFEVAGGVLDGIGTIEGDVANSGGRVSPGHSPGTITINGNYTQTSGGVLDMEIGGTDPGTSYDQMIVNGTANLGGTLNWVRWQNWVPQDGDVYTLFTYYSKTGNFANFVDSSPVAGVNYDITLTPTDYEVSCYATAADAAPPVVSIANPLEGRAAASYANATGTSSANGSASVTGVTCRLYRYNNPVTGVAAAFWAGGSTWTAAATAANERPATGTSSWTFTFPTLVAGRYSLRATATNSEGTTASSSTVSFWVDPNAPSVLTLSTPANNASISTLTNIKGTASDASDGSGVTLVQLRLKRSSDNLYWSGSAWTSSIVALSTSLSGVNWTRNSGFPSGTGLKTGSYVITAIATDRAGNTKTITSNFSVNPSSPAG